MAGALDKIKAGCRLEWPVDYVIQETCFKTQVTAAKKVLELSDTLSAIEEKEIVGRCFQEWRTQAGGTDYMMACVCATDQIEAFRRLQ